MKKTFTISGIGVCLGKVCGCESLVEHTITQTEITGKQIPSSLSLAIKEALQFTNQKNFIVRTDTTPDDCINDFTFGEVKLCCSFREMLENPDDNMLLLSHRENGWLALTLTKEDTGFAQVEFYNSEEKTEGDGFLDFLLSALEIRYALHLDNRETLYRFWDTKGERYKEAIFAGVKCIFTEPKNPVKHVYQSVKYILPIVFTTIDEAKQKLLALKNETDLAVAMKKLLPQLATRNSNTNTIVLVSTDKKALDADIADLLTQEDKLLEKGFVWKTANGSRYICRSCDDPKIVFMNPPASMFNPSAFYKFFLTIYGTMGEISRFETEKLLTGDKDLFLSEYLFDIVVNYCITSLLFEIGIKPDVVSGASMGELANILPHLHYANDTPANTTEVLSRLDAPLKTLTRSDNGLLNEYLGRKTDGFTKFYVKGSANVIRKAAEKYDGAFVAIVGSSEDLILTGDRTSLKSLIEETGCVAKELLETNYTHIPVVAHLEDEIRKGMLEADVHLEQLDYTMFSTYFKKPLDNTASMVADNAAALLTQTVDYAAATKAMYEYGGRVFIDLSTTQLCGTWVSATLKNCKDASVVSIYSGFEPSEILVSLCVTLLASNVPFDFEKLLSKLSFETNEKKEAVPMIKTTNNIDYSNEFASVIRQQMIYNERAFSLFSDAQNKLYRQLLETPVNIASPESIAITETPAVTATTAIPEATAPKTRIFPNASKNYVFDRQQAITMTDTSMSAVLGEKYKEVDKYPVRARMPLPPFMFVSRIVSIDAEFGVFRPSSIVSEYDLDEDCVFRVGDTYICPLVASEASHIVIFLLAYMGLDAISNGTLAYRAIDSNMTAYSERPFRVGDTLRTVLKINRFVNNGSTTLLFFTFESYNGDELISVTEATGGFFTKADLASNKGIIKPKKQLPTKTEPKEFIHFSNTERTAYNKEAMSAFFSADYKACFGVPAKPTQKEIYRVPHSMQMIDRVTNIDYNGGMYRRGIIKGEKDITPDMWPFKAHFKNDPVFPAIIVSDGITQLGMFLFAHAGLLLKFDNANFTMIRGNCVKSKFRGQVRHGYSTLRYDIHIKEVVETEKHICAYFDAEIFNDDLQIMQIDSYVLKISGEAI